MDLSEEKLSWRNVLLEYTVITSVWFTDTSVYNEVISHPSAKYKNKPITQSASSPSFMNEGTGLGDMVK